MQPEDIDKLFRAQLEQHATPPPPSLWYDLQEQLEPAEEKKRRGGFWMAIAAAITLLLLAGGGWLVWQGQLPGGAGSGAPLASRPTPAGSATNSTATNGAAPATGGADFGPEAARPMPTDAATVAANTPAADAARAAEKTSEKSATGQATVDSRPASTPQQQHLLARTERAAAPRKTARPETPAQRLAQAAEVAAHQTVAAQPVTAPALMPATANSLTAPGPAGAPAPALGTIEVEVRQHPDNAVALAAAPAADDAPGRTRPSVRGVLRQVRRLAQGEKPDLTAVGLPASPALTVQARVAGHTLSKTIAL